jgi:hypothetical protein
MAGSVVLLAAGLAGSAMPTIPPEAGMRLHFLQAADAQIIRSIAPVMLGIAGLPLDESCKGWTALSVR